MGDAGTRWTFRLALALIVLAGGLVTRADADLWGHLRFGLDLLETGRLTATDPYSFTQDKPWINHEWLSETLLAASYRLADVRGVVMLKAALLFVAFAVVWRCYRGTAPLPTLVVAAMLVLGTIHMTAVARPQLWTFVCHAVLIATLAHGGWTRRWFLPAVFIVWANSHGGWIVGLAVLAIWAVVESWRSPEDRWRWASLAGLCLLATMATPYGTDLWAFVLTTVRIARPIDEWQSLWAAPVLNWVPWLLSIVAVVPIWRHGDRAAAVTLVFLGYLSLRVQRVESLLVVAAAIAAAPALRHLWPQHAERGASSVQRVVAVLCLAMALVVCGMTARRAFSCVPIFGSWTPDLQAMAAMRDARISGRLVTSFNWGQYAIWHLSPAVTVSIDGRRETVYSDQVVATNEAVVLGRPEGFETLRQWRPDYIWLPSSASGTRAWLAGNGYRIDVDTGLSFVGVAERHPAVRAPQIWPTPCFPG